jgi:membrane protease YdiL (CAAX protease family)
VTTARLVAWAGVVLFWVALAVLRIVAGVPLTDAILLAVLLVAVPVMALAQVPLAEGVEIERLPAYWSSIGVLWLVGTACWFVGTRDGGAAAIGLVGMPVGASVAWTVGLLLAILALVLVFRTVGNLLGLGDTPLLRQLLPRTAQERRVFALLSLAAGTSEELAYRGYVITVLAPLLGTGAAVALSTVVFGIMHAYQGTMGVLRTATMGGLLAWGFLASGSLWPALLAHALFDVLAGIVLGERLLLNRTEGSD